MQFRNSLPAFQCLSDNHHKYPAMKTALNAKDHHLVIHTLHDTQLHLQYQHHPYHSLQIQVLTHPPTLTNLNHLSADFNIQSLAGLTQPLRPLYYYLSFTATITTDSTPLHHSSSSVTQLSPDEEFRYSLIQVGKSIT